MPFSCTEVLRSGFHPCWCAVFRSLAKGEKLSHDGRRLMRINSPVFYRLFSDKEYFGSEWRPFFAKIAEKCQLFVPGGVLCDRFPVLVRPR